MNRIKTLIGQLAYTILSPLINPVVFFQSIWNCRVLLNGDWANYRMFHPIHSLDFLWYEIIHFNMVRYGKRGRSKYLGSGNYKMSNQPQYTSISFGLFHLSTNVTILVGIMGFVLMHLFWLPQVDAWLMVVVLSIGFFSTNFFLNVYHNNYNLLGWAVFPVILYALHQDQFFVLAGMLLLMSFFSITATFISCIFVGITMLLAGNVLPLIYLAVPLVIRLLIHLWPSISDGGGGISDILKFIGGTGKKAVRYKRHDIKRFNGKMVYFSLLIIFLGYMDYTASGEVKASVIITLALFVLNQGFIRFADPQSIYMTMTGVAMYLVLSQGSWLLLIPFFLISNGSPYYYLYPTKGNFIPVLKPFKPFRFSLIQERLNQFIEDLEKDAKVLVAFEDPQDNYEKLFDLQRPFLQGLVNTAIRKDILILGNKWAVIENNFVGSDDWWGRDESEVKNNLKKWQADYLVYYSYERDFPTFLDQNEKLELTAELNWKELSDALERPKAKLPTWRLYKSTI